MKSGYDQFFKKAQKIAAQGKEPPRRQRPSLNPRPQAQDAKILIEQLRSRVQAQPSKKIKKTIQWKLAGFSLVGVLLTSAGFLNMDKIENFLRKIEISLLGSASAAESKAESKGNESSDSKSESKTVAKDLSDKTKVETEENAAKKDFTAEEINHFSKLNERKKELDAREEELNRMEQELANQKLEIEKRLMELETNRKDISAVLQERVQVDDKKVENLVQLYSTMKPQQAAKAFEDMDEGLAIEILGRMKKKSAAEIMNLVKSEKVKVLSEKYAGYKRN